ncbi:MULTISPECIES: hypothetical protein [Oceanobacillus]|uniref:hypothetical protein n=1 Tax=Oceanobacillus TaxID=182709 RepID=UPI00186757F7|nr:hypothetical protein [Oceanobacillus oncorhynchi]UUI41669.1 hypothetical protein NP440_09185 [Oceanobacillus oncorhynchi]
MTLGIQEVFYVPILKISNTSVHVLDLFHFYFCLKAMALIYFEATNYFIQTEQKEVRAPYLAIDKKSIGNQVMPQDNNVIIIPSLFMMNNFSKTFLHHMNKLNVDLTKRGESFETAIQSLFTKHGLPPNSAAIHNT